MSGTEDLRAEHGIYERNLEFMSKIRNLRNDTLTRIHILHTEKEFFVLS